MKASQLEGIEKYNRDKRIAEEKAKRSATLTQKVLEVLNSKAVSGSIKEDPTLTIWGVGASDFPEVARLIVECVKEVGE